MQITWHAILEQVLQRKIKQGREIRGACHKIHYNKCNCHNRDASRNVELRPEIEKFCTEAWSSFL